MKNRWLRLAKKVVAPLALIGAMAAFSPVSALAAEHGGGGRGGFGGHAGGHSYSAPARGFSGGRGFEGARGGAVYGGHYATRYYGRGYGYGFGVGIYPSYGYGYVAPAAPACDPAGFYDQNGVWEAYPGCAVPYGYGY